MRRHACDVTKERRKHKHKRTGEGLGRERVFFERGRGGERRDDEAEKSFNLDLDFSSC